MQKKERWLGLSVLYETAGGNHLYESKQMDNISPLYPMVWGSIVTNPGVMWCGAILLVGPHLNLLHMSFS